MIQMVVDARWDDSDNDFMYALRRTIRRPNRVMGRAQFKLLSVYWSAHVGWTEDLSWALLLRWRQVMNINQEIDELLPKERFGATWNAVYRIYPLFTEEIKF